MWICCLSFVDCDIMSCVEFWVLGSLSLVSLFMQIDDMSSRRRGKGRE